MRHELNLSESVAFRLQRPSVTFRATCRARDSRLDSSSMMIGVFTDELNWPVSLAGAMGAPRSTEAETPQVVDWSDDTTQPDTDAEPALDLYGNEVTVAVAEYKLDAAGRLYEAHAPQSELPQLGSPKS